MIKAYKVCFAFLLLFITLINITGCDFFVPGGVAVAGGLSDEFSDTGGLVLPIVDNPVKLKFLTESYFSQMNDKLVAKTIKELTGVELDIIATPSSNYHQKLMVMFASKQIPDIFNVAFDNGELESNISSGILASFSENLDIAPNIKRLFFDDPEARSMLSSVTYDGQVYVMMGYNISRDINHGFLYRKDIFDKHHIPVWSNTEEFYLALKQLKEIYPDSTPFVAKQQMKLIKSLSSGWGLTDDDVYYDNERQEYLLCATQPEFKQLLDFLKKLYDEGLIDPEFLTCTEDSWVIKMTRPNEAFVTYDWIDRMDLFYDQAKRETPSYDLRFAPPIGPKNVYQKYSKVGSASIAVNNNSHKDISIKLLDFLFSPAGAKLTTLGVEGKSYEINGDGEIIYPGFPSGEIITIKSLEERYGLFVQSIALRFDDRCIYYRYSDKVREAQELVLNNGYLTQEVAKLKSIPTEGREEYTELYYNIRAKTEQFVSKYILGSGDSDAVWSEWIKTAEDLGAGRMMEIYNE